MIEHCAVQVDHRLFILGGIGDSIIQMPSFPYVYNPRLNTWTKKSNPLPYGKIHGCACSTLYIKDGTHVLMMVGGRNENNEFIGNVEWIWTGANDINQVSTIRIINAFIK